MVEEQEEDLKLKKIKQRREEYLKKVMCTVAPIAKSWFLKVGLTFLNEKNLKENEEDILADFTDYYLEKLEELTTSQ